MEQKKNYTLPIVMMFLLFAMISFVTGLSNPLGVIVKNQFAVANWMSQLGNFANFIAYAVMGIPAGMMLKRIGYKKTALAAVAVGFVGVGIQYLSGIAGSFPVYLIGAFVSGFSMCMLNTVVNPMLNTLGGGGKKGNQLIQFGGSLNSISATIVPILVGYLMGNAANATISDAAPALWIAMGIFAVVFFVLAAVRIPEPFAIQDAKSEKKDKHSAMSFRHFVLGTVAIFIYVGVEVGIPNFMNLFLTSTPDAATPGIGMAAAAAGSLVGTYWFLMMCGRLIGGVIGAVVIGIGQGIVVRQQATTGGTDIVGMLLQKFAGIKFSTGILLADGFVVLSGLAVIGFGIGTGEAAANGWMLTLYSLITIYISSRVIAYLLDGASYDKLLFIISDHHEELKRFIIDDLDRSATYIKSKGMYTDSLRDMIFLVVSRKEVRLVQHKIKEIDPKAFVVVTDAYETFGEGFKQFPEKNEIQAE